MVQEGQFAGTTNQPFVRCNAEPSHADLRDDGSGVGYAAVCIDSASACLAPRSRGVTGLDWPVCAGGPAVYLEVSLGAPDGPDPATAGASSGLDARSPNWFGVRDRRAWLHRPAQSNGVGRGIRLSDCVSKCYPGCGHR